MPTPSQPSGTLSRQDRASLLMQEYLALSAENRDYRSLIVQIFGGSALLFAGISAIFTTTKTAPPRELYWAVPPALLAVVLFILQQFVRITFTVTYMKDLEQRLVALTGEPILRHTAVEETLLDIVKAPVRYKTIIGATALGVVGAYIAIVTITLVKMHAWLPRTFRSEGTLYLAAHTLVFLFLIYAYGAGVIGLGSAYRKKMRAGIVQADCHE